MVEPNGNGNGGPVRKLTMSELLRTPSAVIDAVLSRGVRFIITKNSYPAAMLIPIPESLRNEDPLPGAPLAPPARN